MSADLTDRVADQEHRANHARMRAARVAKDAPLPPQLDPAQVPECMRADAHREQWELDAEAAHAAMVAASALVRTRITNCQSLNCHPLHTPDAYHVSGGRDPDGHTVDLTAEWGLKCTCYDHMMNWHYCKHLMRVDLRLGRFFSDDFSIKGVRLPGIYSRALRVELANLARKRAEGAQ